MHLAGRQRHERGEQGLSILELVIALGIFSLIIGGIALSVDS
jgi:hypothetical protein